MRRKQPTPRDLRVAKYLETLESLSLQQLPIVCSTAEIIERILALHSAMLLEAMFEPAVQSRNGEHYIPRAIVTGITPEGRTALSRVSRTMVRSV
jgi:hypothetical protein